VTRHIQIVSDDNSSDQLDAWLYPRLHRPRRPTPPALVVARCVLAAVLVAVVFGLPHVLLSFGSAT
jgi:hypothetical protein